MSVWIVAVAEAIWSVLLELVPWLLLGTAVAGLLHRLVPADFIQRSFQGRLGVLKAVAVGVPLPLCSCGVIPAALGLKKQGASDRATMAFLISTPQTGVDSVLVSAGFLGWPFALFKVLSAGLLGVLGGYAVQDTREAASTTQAERKLRTWRGAVAHGLDVLRTIWPWLVFGVVASALLQVFAPTEGFTTWGTNNLWAFVVVLLVSVPLYVCATASVPIAAALVAGGFPLGAALVFLIAGPATNVATIGTVYRSFGVRSLVIYLTTVILGSIGLGITFDFVLASSVQGAIAHAGHAGIIPSLSASVLILLLLYFAVDDARRWFQKHKRKMDDAVELPVEGMTCNGCVRKLERALRNTDGVDEVEVCLDPGRAKVRSRLAPDRLAEIVRDTGYRVTLPSDRL